MIDINAPRDWDTAVDQDWLGWWFRRDYGQSEFTFAEILRGGTGLQRQIIITMTEFFEYLWDQELGRSRNVLTIRTDSKQLAIDWVQNIYDMMFSGVMRGDDMSKIGIQFDTSVDLDLTSRRVR